MKASPSATLQLPRTKQMASPTATPTATPKKQPSGLGHSEHRLPGARPTGSPAATPTASPKWDAPGRGRSEGAVLELVRQVRRLKVMCITMPEGGHLVPTAQVAMGLAKRSHQVQLVTCACAGDKVAAKARRAGCDFVGVAPHVLAAESGQGRAAELKKRDMMMTMFFHYNDEMHGPVRELVERTRPDIIVADFCTPCAWEVGDEFGIPVMVNVPGPLALFSMFTPLTSATNRLKNLLRFRVPREEKRAMGRIWDTFIDIPYQRPCLVHTFFGLEAAQPVLPNITITGSTAPRSTDVVTETSMPAFNDWLDWVRSEGLKVVYVTMGSMQTLLDFQVRGLYEGLAKIPGVAVAWSLKEEEQLLLPGGGVDGLPKRFFINKWMPQAEALQLPEVRVVVTHCGWGGLNETICAGKPIVATPFRADQPLNASVAKRNGLCEIVDVSKLNAQAVERTVTKVLNEPAYTERARVMRAALMKTGGAEACAEAVERLAERGGSAELLCRRPPLALPPLAKTAAYFLLGVAAACLAKPLGAAALRAATTGGIAIMGRRL